MENEKWYLAWPPLPLERKFTLIFCFSTLKPSLTFPAGPVNVGVAGGPRPQAVTDQAAPLATLGLVQLQLRCTEILSGKPSV